MTTTPSAWSRLTINGVDVPSSRVEITRERPVPRPVPSGAGSVTCTFKLDDRASRAFRRFAAALDPWHRLRLGGRRARWRDLRGGRRLRELLKSKRCPACQSRSAEPCPRCR